MFLDQTAKQRVDIDALLTLPNNTTLFYQPETPPSGVLVDQSSSASSGRHQDLHESAKLPTVSLLAPSAKPSPVKSNPSTSETTKTVPTNPTTPSVQLSQVKSETKGSTSTPLTTPSTSVKEQEKFKPKLTSTAMKSAWSLIEKFAINITGCRPGDYLIGTSVATEGGQLRFVTDRPTTEIYPDQRKLDKIRPFPELWEHFLTKLGNLDYFATMSLPERDAWLTQYQQSGEKAISDTPGVWVTITQPPPVLRDSVTPDDLNQILTSDRIRPSEVEQLIPRKVGSGASRHTLIFIKSFWKIVTTHQITHRYSGTILDIIGGSTVPPGNYTRPIYPVQLDNQTELGLLGETAPTTPVTKQEVYQTLLQQGILTLATTTEGVGQVAQQLFVGFTPAIYKSLLQKLIRFRPKWVTQPGSVTRYPAGEIITLTLVQLIFHPGSFVPDIQRYVSGLESACKRLAIIAVEDSYPNDTRPVVALLGSALLAQRVRSWRPTQSQILSWVEFATTLYQSDRAYHYQSDRGGKLPPYRVSHLPPSGPDNSLVWSSILLDTIRSFAGDLGMFRDLAHQSLATGEPDTVVHSEQPETMDLSHCLDHHCLANLVYFYDYTWLSSQCKPGTTPYAQVFQLIFRQVTGTNPRRQPGFSLTTWANQPVVQQTQLAQRRAIQAIQAAPLEFKTTGQTFSFTTQLDSGWLAGLVGPVTHRMKGHPAVVVTMKPRDPLELAVMVKPARENRDLTLSDQRQSEAISSVRQQLRSGIPLRAVPPPDPSLAKQEVYLESTDDSEGTSDQSYWIRPVGSKKSGRPWEQARQVSVTVGQIQAVDTANIYQAYQYRHTKRQGCVDQTTPTWLSEYPQETIQRVLNVIRTYDTSFQLPSVSKNGGGTETIVAHTDVAVYQLILRLSLWVPAAFTVSRSHLLKFTVHHTTVLWTVCEWLQQELASQRATLSHPVVFQTRRPELKVLSPIDGRQPWPHQTETVQEMLQNYHHGSRGNFLWIPAGMGKTSIVMWYLASRLAEATLPKYLVYTLPTSACQSVITEIHNFNVPVRFILPLKTSRSTRAPPGVQVINQCDFAPGCVNLIEHDHISRCLPELIGLGNDVLFVVDEVHRALSRQTLRTGAILEIAKGCSEFIAFTGTPVINNNIYNLMEWFKMMLPFRLDTGNFLVAMNAMIAKKITTGVKVVEKTVNLGLDDPRWQDQVAHYRSLVPVRKFGGTNPNPSSKDFLRAMDLCYRVCDQKMVELTVAHRSDGVMLVAYRKQHQFHLADLCLEAGIPSAQILVLSTTNPDPSRYQVATSIFLTQDSVDQGDTPDYQVVIASILRPEGYTLSRLGCLITSVYPSNNASREQITARINRMSQQRSEIQNYLVYTGILGFIHQHHESARNLSEALKTLATEITLPDS